MIEDVLMFVFMFGGAVLLVHVVQKLTERKRNLPPGPTGLPVVGYLPFLSAAPHLKFIRLAEKYGDVFSLYLGSQLVVVLNDGDSIREAFSKREFLGRPPTSAFSLFGIETPFFSPDIRMWHEQRKFMVQTMKDLGLGKSKIEGHIQDEVRHFLTVLEKTEGKPMNLVKTLTPSMSNNICALVFGERYDYDNPARVLLDNTLDNVPRTASQTSVHIFFPWIRKVPFLVRFFNYDGAIQAAKKILEYIDEKISEHKKTLEPGNVRDYIDGYLIEMKERKEKDPKTTFSVALVWGYSYSAANLCRNMPQGITQFSEPRTRNWRKEKLLLEETMKGSVVNFFGAGSETVRTSVTWCMYVMAAFPEVQRKVREEIKRVLGSGKFPEITDQKDMPYTQAVIREIMRWKTIVPLNVLRYTNDDTDVCGFDVPKGTIVMANFWAVHHSPKHWENPEEFRPGRFLNPDGTLVKTNYFMPFSVGKRSCPGETMAMMEVFLYFVSVLQKFEVCFPRGFQPDFEAQLGITFSLQPFKICFKSQ